VRVKNVFSEGSGGYRWRDASALARLGKLSEDHDPDSIFGQQPGME
jgi:hypothetical protein